MNFRFLMVTVVSAAFCLISEAGIKAKFVEASGVGETEDAALTEALRNAIVRAGYLKVSARQKLSDGEMSYDEVATEANAYVDTYEILVKGKDPKTGLKKLKIKARIIPIPPSSRTKYVTPPSEVVRCPKCKGEGRVRYEATCGKCRGGGLLPHVLKRGIGGRDYVTGGGTCPKCKGKGVEVHSEICHDCHGKRTVRADDVVE